MPEEIRMLVVSDFEGVRNLVGYMPRMLNLQDIRIEVFATESLRAEEVFWSRPFDIVAIDGDFNVVDCSPSFLQRCADWFEQNCNCLDFVKWLVKVGSSAVHIAISYEAKHNDMLLRAGCHVVAPEGILLDAIAEAIQMVKEKRKQSEE